MISLKQPVFPLESMKNYIFFKGGKIFLSVKKVVISMLINMKLTNLSSK